MAVVRTAQRSSQTPCRGEQRYGCTPRGRGHGLQEACRWYIGSHV